MNAAELTREIIATYQRHGWQLRRALLRPETRQAIESEARELFGDASQQESDFDALWFARDSQGKREAWELRLIAAQPYALLEAFEASDDEEDREAARRELENRMRKFGEKSTA